MPLWTLRPAANTSANTAANTAAPTANSAALAGAPGLRRPAWPALTASSVAALVISGCKPTLIKPYTEVKSPEIHALAVPPAPIPGQTVRGRGWYPDLERDSTGRLHLVYTDADQGDVVYRTAAPGTIAFGPEQPVETAGAVGAYTRLAIAPGDAPVVSYYNQDRHQLRLAHRPADYPAMQKAGVEVDTRPASSMSTEPVYAGLPPRRVPTAGMGPGWFGEDIAFGDNAGKAQSIVVDKKGYVHVVSYAGRESFRYTGRAEDGPAFGLAAMDRFGTAVLDERAGGSPNMRTDLVLLDDGTLMATYCAWNFVESALKATVRLPGKNAFTAPVELSHAHKLVDGWHSSIVPTADGKVDVYSVASGVGQLLRGRVDPKNPTTIETPTAVMPRPKATVVRTHGTDVWVLTRATGLANLGEPSGVWLYKFKGGDPAAMTRWLLERDNTDDPWIDLELTADGKPVATWFSGQLKTLRVYAPGLSGTPVVPTAPPLVPPPPVVDAGPQPSVPDAGPGLAVPGGEP